MASADMCGGNCWSGPMASADMCGRNCFVRPWVQVGLFTALRSLDLSHNSVELEIALSPCAALAESGLEEISVWGNEVAEHMAGRCAC